MSTNFYSLYSTEKAYFFSLNLLFTIKSNVQYFLLVDNIAETYAYSQALKWNVKHSGVTHCKKVKYINIHRH